jgi:hypothetical protein
MTNEAQYNEEISIRKTEEFFKKNGINKTLEEMYDEYFCNKSTKEMKWLKQYLKDKVGSSNPYHIYNQFYYFNGIPPEN